jgi:hypothetical protein
MLILYDTSTILKGGIITSGIDISDIVLLTNILAQLDKGIADVLHTQLDHKC